MNKLPRQKRVEILSQLCEGMSLRAVTRTTGVSINTVTALLVTAAKACSDYQDRVFRDLPCRRLQIDEIWAFCYAKAKNVASAKAAPDMAGDIWTWVALDSDTKLVPSWLVGSRDAHAAMYFLSDLAGRMSGRIQLSTDGYKPYRTAVPWAFGEEIDYAQVVKHYAEMGSAIDERRYSPGEYTGCTKGRIIGNPAHISTSHAEPQNLTMRMHMRRFTKLTNAFTKKAENHAHAVALHFMYYNFCRIHQALRVTPAMKAGVTDHLWDVVDLVRMIEQWEARQAAANPSRAA